MSEIEPRRRPKKELAPRHIPSEIVPIPISEASEFVRDALKGTSLMDPFASILAGWIYFEPYVRFSEVDATNTRVEFDVAGRVPGAETFLYTRKVGEIDRFFVALQDELDRRDRWRPQAPAGGGSIES